MNKEMYPCRKCGIEYCYKNCADLNSWIEKAEVAIGVMQSPTPYQDDYQQGYTDAIKQYTCHDDCTNDNCSMCCRWDKLVDFYEVE